MFCHVKGGYADYLSDKKANSASDYSTKVYIATRILSPWQFALTYVICTDVPISGILNRCSHPKIKA